MSSQLSNPQGLIRGLYLEHHAWLRAWIQKRLGCPNWAADLTQDTFVNLLLKHELPVLNEPRAYLSRVAHGLMVDHVRRRDLERAYLEALAYMAPAEVGSPETRAIMLELLVRLDIMLDGLPHKTRTAFLLAQLEGASYPQISERLGVSVRTVGSYVSTAMLQCMTLLQEPANAA
ncbi:sigma-70 family RNA polymerase sigma factor [Methylophilus sp. 13]|uniref:sigma-70 family RNA polymerase sigma factor n=1 Tax=Methylophilus sp. 13 TaxID=2781018 RepID=UPI00188E337E|nr:sigma-70 family RNA polymerase sigma factor [Methylophilus sp. 13]MBF5039419.1 sigma-70 family RNA polymerase sigma factor [Methylophilus sp. 13]